MAAESLTRLRTAQPGRHNHYGVQVLPMSNLSAPEEQLLLATAQHSGIQCVRALPLPGGKRALLIKDNNGQNMTLVTARPIGEDGGLRTAQSVERNLGGSEECLISQMASLHEIGKSVSVNDLANTRLIIPTGPSPLTDYPSEYMDASLEMPYDQNMQKKNIIPMDFVYGERAKARLAAAKKWQATFGCRRLDTGEYTPMLSHYEANDSQASKYCMDDGVDDVTDAVLARIHALLHRRDTYNAAQRVPLSTAVSGFVARRPLQTARSQSRELINQYWPQQATGMYDYDVQQEIAARGPREAPQDRAIRLAREYNDQQLALFPDTYQPVLQNGFQGVARVPSNYYMQ